MYFLIYTFSTQPQWAACNASLTFVCINNKLFSKENNGIQYNVHNPIAFHSNTHGQRMNGMVLSV